MLVLGWTFNGTLRSSYDNTMGFGVSARGDICSTLQSVTPPQDISSKINQLSGILSGLCYFCEYKSNQKTLGYSPNRFLSIATASAELAGDMSAHSDMQRNLLIAADLMLKNLIAWAHKSQTLNKYGMIVVVLEGGGYD